MKIVYYFQQQTKPDKITDRPQKDDSILEKSFP